MMMKQAVSIATIIVGASLGVVSATNVALAAQIMTNPASVTVCKGATQQFTATRGMFTQTATSGNTAVATVSPPGGTSPVTYTVTGVATGSTSISLTDTQGGAGSEPVSVNGPISPPSPLTFNGTPATNITVMDPGPPITVYATSLDTSVATVTASAQTSGGQATFTVTPVNGSKNGVAPATTTITFTDAANCASKTVSVTVYPGSLSLSATSLSFAGTGAASQTFTASETDYTGLLSATSGNSSVATVTPASGNGPGPVTFTVAPKGFGTTSITVADDQHRSTPVSVLVSGGAIAIPGSSTANFTANDNRNAHLAASAIRVTGSLQTTPTGSAQLAVMSPGNVTGSLGGSLLIAYLTYNCTANGAGTDQGGTFATGFLQLIANAQASSCVTFPSNQFANLDVNVNLFLDDRAVPADTYSTPRGNGFQVVLSAT